MTNPIARANATIRDFLTKTSLTPAEVKIFQDNLKELGYLDKSAPSNGLVGGKTTQAFVDYLQDPKHRENEAYIPLVSAGLRRNIQEYIPVDHSNDTLGQKIKGSMNKPDGHKSLYDQWYNSDRRYPELSTKTGGSAGHRLMMREVLVGDENNIGYGTYKAVMKELNDHPESFLDMSIPMLRAMVDYGPARPEMRYFLQQHPKIFAQYMKPILHDVDAVPDKSKPSKPVYDALIALSAADYKKPGSEHDWNSSYDGIIGPDFKNARANFESGKTPQVSHEAEATNLRAEFEKNKHDITARHTAPAMTLHHDPAPAHKP